jgi:hypothetical protein
MLTFVLIEHPIPAWILASERDHEESRDGNFAGRSWVKLAPVRLASASE